MSEQSSEKKKQVTLQNTANKSPLKWILLAALLTLTALILFKDHKYFKQAAPPLFNPPAKSPQELQKENSKSAEENKLKEKF